jgi:hypothetical protein
MKRFLVLSDLHCGHVFGLTPPKWQTLTAQKRLYQWYLDALAKLQPIDGVLVNGDAIDGKGERNGGVELITADRLEQVNMALEAIQQTKASKFWVTIGTAYHTGDKENFEKILADKLDAKCGDILRIDVAGLLLQCRHKVNSSQVPQGRATPLIREQTWNILRESIKQELDINIVIRSHVHYYCCVENSFGIALTTPCLQLDSSYGRRECSGSTDIGMVYFDVADSNNFQMGKVISRGNFKKFEVTSL